MTESIQRQQEASVHAHEMKQVVRTTCCIVGGGPAGAVLALLLARKGISVLLLEAHMDFDREFRGDTIHPSTMNIMDELGLADRLLQIRHTKLQKANLQTNNGPVPFIDLSRLKTKFPYITIMAQSQFLEFLTDEAKRYPNFQLIMGAQVDELIEENGVVRGVRYRGHDGWYEVQATLTVAADGRFSRIRRLSGFELVKTSPPMDVLWFRLSRKEGDTEEGIGGRFGNKVILVLLNRFDYWQAGYIIPKGSYQQIRAAGIAHFQHTLAETAPEFADRVDELKEWKQVAVLSVESSRLTRWYRPGLLLIGDAAHVMSPVGGVGINYAVQDAVAAANVLTEKLKYGTLQTRDLARMQRQRELQTRIIQAIQALLQERILAGIFRADGPIVVPCWLRLLFSVPAMRALPARMIAFGPFPTHLKK
ncbi:MAG: FAD-dependent oxidoreductase [Ktedonobacteraceae bacterium]